MLEGIQLERVSTYRYLGVNIDSRLDFSFHTQCIATSAKRGIGALCHSIRKWAPKQILCTSITAIVLPAFLYAIEVWYPPHLKDKVKLERVNKFAARLILNVFDKQVTYDELLKKLSWKPIYRVVAERRLLLIRKYLEGKRFAPNFLFPLELANEYRHSERIKCKLHKHSLSLMIMSSQKNVLEVKLAAAHMRILWNSLDETLIKLPFNEFKTRTTSDEVFGYLCSCSAIIQLVVDD